MVKGQKPMATAVKRDRGTFLKDPGRENKAEPKLEGGIPKMPTSLNGDRYAQATWKRILGYLQLMKIETLVDLDLVEQFAVNKSLMMKSKKGLNEADDKIRREHTANFHKTMDRQMRLIPELGLSPSSRTRLIARLEPESDVFEQFIKMGSKN